MPNHRTKKSQPLHGSSAYCKGIRTLVSDPLATRILLNLFFEFQKHEWAQTHTSTFLMDHRRSHCANANSCGIFSFRVFPRRCVNQPFVILQNECCSECNGHPCVGSMLRARFQYISFCLSPSAWYPNSTRCHEWSENGR